MSQVKVRQVDAEFLNVSRERGCGYLKGGAEVGRAGLGVLQALSQKDFVAALVTNQALLSRGRQPPVECHRPTDEQSVLVEVGETDLKTEPVGEFHGVDGRSHLHVGQHMGREVFQHVRSDLHWMGSTPGV